MIHNQILNEIPDLAQQVNDLKGIVAEKELILSLSSDISRIKGSEDKDDMHTSVDIQPDNLLSHLL